MIKKVLHILLVVSLLVTSFPADVCALELQNIIATDEVITEDVEASVIETEADMPEVEEIVSEDYASKGLDDSVLELGYHGMQLDSEQLSKKSGLKSTAESLKKLESDTDYAGNRITYMAETKAEALAIADCYNAELVFYEYGVAAALVDFTDELSYINVNENVCDVPTDIPEIISMASDSNNNLPAVYPDYIYRLDDEEIVLDADESDLSEIKYMAAAKRGYTTNDPNSAAQYYHDYLKDYEAWKAGYTGQGITVAVVDTGINLEHEDLAGKITKFRYNSIASDPYNKYIAGKNYKSSSDVTDDNGHGTHCSGIIGALKDNGKGGTGVAPDAMIMPIKVLDAKGSGTTCWVAAGIIAAADNGADIISLSLSGVEDSLKEQACNHAIANGVVVVASAGNESTQDKAFPACYDGVIAVASLATNDDYIAVSESKPEASVKGNSNIERGTKTKDLDLLKSYDTSKPVLPSYFTNYFEEVDVSACGSGIYSTYAFDKNRYDVLSGTSQACPEVSGVVALILCANRNIKALGGQNVAQKVESILKETGVNVSKGKYIGEVKYTNILNSSGATFDADIVLNCPYVDASKAVSMASEKVKEPTINFDKLKTNSDGTYKSGEEYRLKITSLHNVKYTDDGSDPVKYGIPYPEEGILLDFTGVRTFKAVACNENEIYSDVATFTGQFNAPITSVIVNSTAKVLPGKTAQIKVNYLPCYAAYKTFTYESSNKDVFTVTNKGALKANAKANKGDKAVITVTDTVSGLKGTITAIVETESIKTKGIVIPDNINPKEYVMSVTPTTLFAKDAAKKAVYSNEFNIKEALSKNNDYEQLTVESSNSKVLLFDSNEGILYARKSGKSKVTIKANDGSGVKAVINVKVISPVINMLIYTDTGYATDKADSSTPSVTGEAFIGSKGCKVKLIPEFNDMTEEQPEKSMAKLKFESSNTDILKVNGNGVVTPAKGATKGAIAYITASTTDGSNLSVKYKFKVCDAIKDLKLTYEYRSRKPVIKFGFLFLAPIKYARMNSVKGTADKGIYIASSNPKYNSFNNEAYRVYLDYINPSEDTKVYVFHSGPGSVNVCLMRYSGSDEYYDIKLEFDEPGKHKVDLVANDGSGKKITFDIVSD